MAPFLVFSLKVFLGFACCFDFFHTFLALRCAFLSSFFMCLAAPADYSSKILNSTAKMHPFFKSFESLFVF